MNINPQAASLAQKDVQQAAMTQADIEAARKSEQHALEVQQMLSRLEERRITPSKELPKMEFLFRLFHKPCFPRGELVALSGKAKSGKTFVSSILMALSFRSQVLSVERIEPKRLHVLWYDTEQSEESTQDILRSRIIPMTGISEDQFPTDLFDVFKVRELFTDSMEPGKQYYEDELLNRIGLASNIVTEKILSEQLTRALSEGILLQSRSALNGKKIYMLHQQAQPVPTQQTLNFDENAE